MKDATVKLWERREGLPKKGRDNDSRKRFGLFNMALNQNAREYTWVCKSTFQPKSEAVREIQWSKFHDDGEPKSRFLSAKDFAGSHTSSVFALVTVSGSLVIYSMHVSWKSIVKIAAHAGDATSLDWHPTRPYVIATGGSGDRCVKGGNSCSVLKHGTLTNKRMNLTALCSLGCGKQREHEARRKSILG